MLGPTSSLRAGGRERVIGLAIAALIGVAVLVPSSAHATGCENSWTNSTGGSWFKAENWSKKAVPTSAEEVCITESGTYTVEMTQTTGTVSVKALTIGGASGTQTLLVGSSGSVNAILATTAGIANGAHGAITLTNGDTAPNAVTLTGSISNSGTITSEQAHGGGRTLQGNVTNTGTIAINANTAYNGASAALSNEGAIDVAEGKQLTVSNKGSVSNGTGGKISATGNGEVLVEGAGTSFTEGAGTTSGTKPVIVERSTLNYAGSGASAIALHAADSLSGSLASGQSLSIESTSSANAEVTAATGFTNAGSITLTNGDSASNFATLVTTSGTLTNSGTITSEQAHGGGRTLQGNVTNTGTIAINANTTDNAASPTLLNEGAINIGTGVALSVPSKPTISNETGGTIAGTGNGALVQTEGTFSQGLGTTTGSEPVILDRAALHYAGTGASTIALRGVSTLSGTISAGQGLSIQSSCSEHATTTAAASFASSGTIDLTNGDTCPNNATLNITGEGTLTNKATGTINSESPHGGTRTIGGSVKNEGTLSLSAGQTLKVTDDYTQTGAGTFKSAIAGASSFGALSVTGTAKLAGALVVTEVAPFVGKAGESFAVLASSKVTGTFTDLDGVITTTPGLYYKPTYSGTGVTLALTQATVTPMPTEGTAGSSVTLKGSGLLPKDKVKLTFTDVKKGKTVFPTATVGVGGEFSAEGKLSTKAAKGVGTFTATSTTITGLVVTATFTVT
ncbi:MAG: beta strand repeat-containing protein [Solirubrobacterales bacterium]